jgi:hypothetical protein
MSIFFFQITLPSCGTHLGNPHIYYKSSKLEIPPAIITFLIGPGTLYIISLSCSLGTPFSFPYALLKVILTFYMPSSHSSTIFLATSTPVFTVLAWVSTSHFSLIESSTIILDLLSLAIYLMMSKLLDMTMCWK